MWKCDTQNMYFVAFVLEGERSCSPQECNRQVERQCGGVMPKACTVSEGEAAHLKSKARQRTESVEMQ